MKLALGTVQFGLLYGIANKSGKPSQAEIESILRAAGDAGVGIVDTACSYGDSEAVIGQCLSPGHKFRIVTKTPKFGAMLPANAVQYLERSFDTSCRHLGMQQLYGLLVHDANDLLGPSGDEIWHAMMRLRNAGRVSRIGASVYTGDQIDALLERFQLDLVQAPLSLLDQRLVQGGHLDRMARAGVEIHARSVFLQGSLLMAPEQLPPYLSKLAPYLENVAARAKLRGISPLQAALRYVAGLPQVTAIITGVDSRQHFSELAEALRSMTPALSADDALACACHEHRLLDPSGWNTQ